MLGCMQEEIAFMFRTTVDWYTSFNRMDPCIGAPTQLTLHIRKRASVFEFDITKRSSRTLHVLQTSLQ